MPFLQWFIITLIIIVLLRNLIGYQRLIILRCGSTIYFKFILDFVHSDRNNVILSIKRNFQLIFTPIYSAFIFLEKWVWEYQCWFRNTYNYKIFTYSKTWRECYWKITSNTNRFCRNCCNTTKIIFF